MGADIPTDWRVIQANVDYWSGTTDQLGLGEWAIERARDYIEADNLGRTLGTRSSVLGYAGVASDHAFAGERDGSVLIRFSSVGASSRWHEFVGAGLHTTRIDTATTCTSGVDIPTLAYSVRYGVRLPSNHRGAPPRLTFYSTEGEGDTIYVGSPGSSRRGRLYDKARESKGAYPVGAWRWEVQSRHELARDVSSALAGRDDAEEWISAYTRNWFAERGVPAPWPTKPIANLLRMKAPQTTDERRMEWLKKSIAPMIEKMTYRFTVRQLREALGLQYDKPFAKEVRTPKRNVT